MDPRVKRVLKTARASQPFNAITVRSLRFLSKQIGAIPVELLSKYLPPSGVVDSVLPNGTTMRMWSEAGPSDDQVARVVFWKGWREYQPSTTQLFYELATKSRQTIDVGAHVGFYSLLAGLANADGNVAAFEALPRVFERLERNVTLNRLDNVTCNNVAAGSRPGHTEFHHARDGFPSSSSLSSEFMHSSLPDDELTSTTVEVLKIDDYVERHKIERVDLVKLDTESTESDVLAGFQETMGRDCPDIICEVLPIRDAGRRLENQLRPHGYRYYALTPNGPEPRDAIEGSQLFGDWLFSTSELDDLRTCQCV